MPAQLPVLLARAQDRFGGAIALLSGRRIEDLDHWLAPFRGTAVGVHGAQRRVAAGQPIQTGPAPDLAPVRAALAEGCKDLAGVWIEDKRVALALHFRAAAESAPACLALAAAVAARFGLRALPGKMVVELKPVDVDKGRALRGLMALPPFHGRRPLFLGDDCTDEHGFAAAQALGGAGVRIGPGPTGARFRLPDVTAALAWLQRSIDGGVP